MNLPPEAWQSAKLLRAIQLVLDTCLGYQLQLQRLNQRRQTKLKLCWRKLPRKMRRPSQLPQDQKVKNLVEALHLQVLPRNFPNAMMSRHHSRTP